MSAPLAGSRCTLKDVLARIPGLERAYERTFADSAAGMLSSVSASSGPSAAPRPNNVLRPNDLHRLVQGVRAKFPFLDDWCFTQGSRAGPMSDI